MKASQAKVGRKGGFFAKFSPGRRSPLEKWSPWAKANPLFDADWYVSQYPDIEIKGIAASKHYDRYGVYEGRNPNSFFDTNWDFDRYPEVRSANENPLNHYLEWGGFHGYDPCPHFSSLAYFDKNPDIRKRKINPLLHYLQYGRREGRALFPAEPISPPQNILLPIVTGCGGSVWLEVQLKVDWSPIRFRLSNYIAMDENSICGSTEVGKEFWCGHSYLLLMPTFSAVLRYKWLYPMRRLIKQLKLSKFTSAGPRAITPKFKIPDC